MTEWNISYYGVSICCIDRFIQIKNDKKLKKLLNQKGTDSLALAKEAKKQYKKQFGKDIDITTNSLAIEILGHVYIEDVVKVITSLPGLPSELKNSFKKFHKEIKSHTDIIDCGEKAVDSNRHIWDSLEKYSFLIIPALDH